MVGRRPFQDRCYNHAYHGAQLTIHGGDDDLI